MDICQTNIHFRKCWFCDELIQDIGLCKQCKYDKFYKKKKIINRFRRIIDNIYIFKYPYDYLAKILTKN